MKPSDYLINQLNAGMYTGNMHTCLRNVGRLAGGLLVAGDLSLPQVTSLGEQAEGLANNAEQAREKWTEAVEHGRAEPVYWAQHQHSGGKDRALDWTDVIGDYRVVDPKWTEPVEVLEPDAWNPVAEVIRYLETLFAAEDHVGYVTEAWVNPAGEWVPSRGSYGRTAGELLAELARYKDLSMALGDCNPEAGAWVRFNPLDGQGVKDANVTDFRFTLVESDSMPIEEQRGIYEQLELPIAIMVHSGNKSLHAIVRIEADSLPEYRRRVDLLYDVCRKNGLTIDSANRNPSRLSRLPGVERKGQKQYIVATHVGKPSWAAWEEWIAAVNDDLPKIECLPATRDEAPALAPPLIDGVLRQGHKMLVSGPSKAGKSFLLIQLCAAIAEGREWLGRLCTAGKVLYVNLELDHPSAISRFFDVYEALGWPRDHFTTHIDLWNLRGQAVPMDRLAPKLIRRAKKKQYTAIVIDPIYKVLTGDENAADKMAHFCNQFDKVCHELKAAVIYCHHHSKGAQGGKRSMDRASGSGVFARDPDALLDLIELTVTDHLRKQQENTAVCGLVANALDRDCPGWRDSASDDDLLSESQMRALAARLMGDRYRAVLPAIYDCRQALGRQSAWRVEGTFREFPCVKPVDVWFRHPCHRIDSEGVLADVDPPDPYRRGKTPARDGKARDEEREAAAKARLESDLRTVIDVLAENPAGLTKTGIRDFSGVRTERLGPALALALRKGYVVTCEVPATPPRKSPFSGFMLSCNREHTEHTEH
ncbi:MAG: AAA family ATPase [Patescibacteria group bacterium]|nr:AAA family ATPase [Patescibacteria group bacterium]